MAIKLVEEVQHLLLYSTCNTKHDLHTRMFIISFLHQKIIITVITKAHVQKLDKVKTTSNQNSGYNLFLQEEHCKKLNHKHTSAVKWLTIKVSQIRGVGNEVREKSVPPFKREHLEVLTPFSPTPLSPKICFQ